MAPSSSNEAQSLVFQRLYGLCVRNWAHKLMGRNPWAAGTSLVPLPTATHLQPVGRRVETETLLYPLVCRRTNRDFTPYLLRSTEADRCLLTSART
jgi:hypothetical protein